MLPSLRSRETRAQNSVRFVLSMTPDKLSEVTPQGSRSEVFQVLSSGKHTKNLWKITICTINIGWWVDECWLIIWNNGGFLGRVPRHRGFTKENPYLKRMMTGGHPILGNPQFNPNWWFLPSKIVILPWNMVGFYQTWWPWKMVALPSIPGIKKVIAGLWNGLIIPHFWDDVDFDALLWSLTRMMVYSFFVFDSEILDACIPILMVTFQFSRCTASFLTLKPQVFMLNSFFSRIKSQFSMVKSVKSILL